MNLLPEWAPNLHPFLVHFPIALLVTAVIIDWAGILSRPATRTPFTTALYFAGTLTLVGTFLTGRDAAQTVLLPGMAHAVVEDHRAWATGCLWVFVGVTALRLGLRGQTTRSYVRLLLATGGLVGVALLVRTADLGGQLVYKYGVGTRFVAVHTGGQDTAVNAGVASHVASQSPGLESRVVSSAGP